MKMFAIPVLLLLAGCGETATTATPGELPPAPADIQSCFRAGASVVPPRTLTVAEVEALWKSDRVRIAVMRRCGTRFLAWYGSLRATWR